MPHRCPPGSTVFVRDADWRVTRVEAFEDCALVSLEGPGRRRIRVIDPADRIAPARTGRIARRPRRAVIRTALHALAVARPPLALWTAAGAAIDLLPYQLEPALAVLRGATRVLLADGVGLGKTIQAGLILAELRERGWADRALVLCPPGLRPTWARELHDRFAIPCAVFDQASIADVVAAIPAGINPWSTHAMVIASIDLAKRPEVLAAIAEVPFDVVVADEAHHLTPGSERGEAVRQLASRSPWCVLVSATPHSGDEAAFNYLQSLGAHDDPIAIFRRTRRDAGIALARRERLVRMRPAEPEIELLAAVEEYARAIWRGRAAVDPALQLVAITIARRAASSPLALERTLQRRLSLLSSVPEPVQTVLPWDEEDDADGCGPSGLLAQPGLDSASHERATIERLLALVERCRTSSKLQWLLHAVQRVKEPAIVFTEYRDTLEALLAMLPRALRAASICGATPIDLRRAAVNAFNCGAADLLIATDTAGEGLNLHHRCRLVIDVELPWNPMRLEQRLGRVDRLGQRHRVHAWRLFHPGTIEERVLERLQLRRRRAESIDQHEAADERVIAAQVFGSTNIENRPARRITSCVVSGADLEQVRLVQQRASTDANTAANVPQGTAPESRCPTAMVALHSAAYINSAGSLIAELPCAHSVHVDLSRIARRSDSLETVVTSERLRESIRAQGAATRAAIARDLSPVARAMTRRVDSIRSHLAEQQSRAIQPSLFDGRADVAAERQTAASANLDAALLRRGVSVDGSVPPEGVSIRLIAIWPADPR